MEILYEEPDNGFIGITWNEALDNWEMHIECLSWSHTKFKRYLKGLEIAKQKLRDKGIKKVYGICASKKERKFNIVFGAKEVPGGLVLPAAGLFPSFPVLAL